MPALWQLQADPHPRMILYGPTNTYWGPYCALPQDGKYSIELGGYVRVVYPIARAWVMHGGVVHELDQCELDRLADRYQAALARSLQEDWV